MSTSPSPDASSLSFIVGCCRRYSVIQQWLLQAHASKGTGGYRGVGPTKRTVQSKFNWKSFISLLFQWNVQPLWMNLRCKHSAYSAINSTIQHIGRLEPSCRTHTHKSVVPWSYIIRPFTFTVLINVVVDVGVSCKTNQIWETISQVLKLLHNSIWHRHCSWTFLQLFFFWAYAPPIYRPRPFTLIECNRLFVSGVSVRMEISNMIEYSAILTCKRNFWAPRVCKKCVKLWKFSFRIAKMRNINMHLYYDAVSHL